MNESGSRYFLCAQERQAELIERTLDVTPSAFVAAGELAMIAMRRTSWQFFSSHHLGSRLR